MKLYYLKREKGRNEILETNISDRLYHSDNFAALLERICQQFPCVSVGYPASGADYDSRKSDSHDDDLYGDVDHCFFIPIYYLQGMPSEMLVQLAMPGAFFYIVYGMMFKLQIRNKHIANLENVIAAAFFCDLCSNIFENFLAALLKNNAMPGPDMIQKLFMIAAVRTLFVALALIGEQQYRLLLTKADHESRYQRLFLMTTGLKTEIYLMHKNTEEIERVMSNAYKLYEQILEKDLPREMQQMGLEIARDVHEIKKDYIRIIQGIEEAIEEESNEETMSLQDLLRILESSTYRTMAEKKLDIRLMFDCRDNFMTQEHYQLMTILKNLVGNAVEAIESTKKSGMIWIREYKKDGNYVFEVADD